MNTLRKRLKAAKELHKKTYETTIIYEIVCNLKDNLPIDIARDIDEAREIIKGINEYYIEYDGMGIRLLIRPVVVDNDSYEPVTEKNMMYYDLNSDWVKEHIRYMNS